MNWNELLTMLGPVINSWLPRTTNAVLFAASAANFWKRDCQLSSASESAFLGYFKFEVVLNMLNFSKKRCSHHMTCVHIKSLPRSIVTNDFCFSVSVYLSLSLFLKSGDASSSNWSSGAASGGNGGAIDRSLNIIDLSLMWPVLAYSAEKIFERLQ